MKAVLKKTHKTYKRAKRSSYKLRAHATELWDTDAGGTTSGRFPLGGTANGKKSTQTPHGIFASRCRLRPAHDALADANPAVAEVK
jgi:hypothetical protein